MELINTVGRYRINRRDISIAIKYNKSMVSSKTYKQHNNLTLFNNLTLNNMQSTNNYTKYASSYNNWESIIFYNEIDM